MCFCIAHCYRKPPLHQMCEISLSRFSHFFLCFALVRSQYKYYMLPGNCDSYSLDLYARRILDEYSFYGLIVNKMPLNRIISHSVKLLQRNFAWLLPRPNRIHQIIAFTANELDA